MPPYYFLSCLSQKRAYPLQTQHLCKGQGGHRSREAQKNPSPPGSSPQWAVPGSFPLRHWWDWSDLSLATASPPTQGKAVISIFWGPTTSLLLTTWAGRLWIHEERDEKNSSHRSWHVNQSKREKSLLPFAGASVMSAYCCFSLLKGTRSSPDWPITLTLAAPCPHQYTPEALITLAKQKLRYSSTIHASR